jgi:hypothetical protein
MPAYQFPPAPGAYQAVGRIEPFYFVYVPVKEGNGCVQPGIQEGCAAGILRQPAEPLFQGKTHDSIVGVFSETEKDRWNLSGVLPG